MKRTFFIKIFIILLIPISIFAIYIYYQKNDSDNNEKRDILYSEQKLSLMTNKGSIINVDNFITSKNVTQDSNNEQLYFIGKTFSDATEGSSATSYLIVFDVETKYFNIALLNKPFNKARLEAEMYLKNTLKISDSEMCSLIYSVSVPGYVDDTASGVDYRFSFCPDNIKL